MFYFDCEINQQSRRHPKLLPAVVVINRLSDLVPPVSFRLNLAVKDIHAGLKVDSRERERALGRRWYSVVVVANIVFDHAHFRRECLKSRRRRVYIY